LLPGMMQLLLELRILELSRLVHFVVLFHLRRLIASRRQWLYIGLML
jgi:hypothetical protein